MIDKLAQAAGQQGAAGLLEADIESGSSETFATRPISWRGQSRQYPGAVDRGRRRWDQRVRVVGGTQ